MTLEAEVIQPGYLVGIRRLIRRLRGRRGIGPSAVREMSDEDRAAHAVEREHREQALKQGDLYLTEFGDPAANWLPNENKRNVP
jgi:hypothetical protein